MAIRSAARSGKAAAVPAVRVSVRQEAGRPVRVLSLDRDARRRLVRAAQTLKAAGDVVGLGPVGDSWRRLAQALLAAARLEAVEEYGVPVVERPAARDGKAAAVAD